MEREAKAQIGAEKAGLEQTQKELLANEQALKHLELDMQTQLLGTNKVYPPTKYAVI